MDEKTQVATALQTALPDMSIEDIKISWNGQNQQERGLRFPNLLFG